MPAANSKLAQCGPTTKHLQNLKAAARKYYILQMSKKHVALLSKFRQEAVSKPHYASLQYVSTNFNPQ